MSESGFIAAVDVGRMPSEDLAALLRVSSMLASTLDLPSIMQTAITSACELMDLETGAIYLLDGSTLVLQATAPPTPPDFPDMYRRAPLQDHPHIARCLIGRDPIFVEDSSKETMSPAEAGICEARGLRSILYVPLVVDAVSAGAFIMGSIGRAKEMGKTDVDLCRTLAHQISLAINNAQLHDSLLDANTHLARAYDETLAGWALALEMRDHETRGHSDRVERLTMQLAAEMGIPREQWDHVRRGTLLHDIGKMGVPDAILQKPGPLTDDEWAIMRTHPQKAREMLGSIDFLAPALDIPYCHHERWDGTGYPRGLAGDAIPLAARIFSVVDVYDALTSDRHYRPGWSRQQALDYIRQETGLQFDPRVVEAFFSLIGEAERGSGLETVP
ncbi:MAG: HD domain-containing protein [Thermoanaerobaculia bacterium]|nr:HD domain-containing protein [Thermoanaerobaculia bacterium]